MFNEEFIRSMKKFAIFLLSYTVAFFLFYKTMSYTFPFIVAFIIAFLIQPVTRFFKESLKLKKSIPSLLSSIFVYLLFFIIISVLFYKVVSEIRLFLLTLPNINLNTIIKPIQDLIDKISLYFTDINPSFFENNSSQIANFASKGLDILGKSANTFLSIAMSIPVWITVLFIVILSTYFFSRDMSSIKKSMMSIFSEKGREKFASVAYEGIRMLTRYVKAYSIIYSLTFIQTLAGFLIFRVKYAVILSIVCGIADVFPILGIGIIYIPLAAIYLISGKYITAVGIIVLFILISVVRQIVEPKIVSTSLGIHPLLVLAAIFIGLKAYGFIGMIYLTFLIVLYKILKTAKVL